MNTDEQRQELRRRMSANLMLLQELAGIRNRLLQRAAMDSRPTVAHALRLTHEQAELARKAARLARAQLAALETNHREPSDTPSTS